MMFGFLGFFFEEFVGVFVVGFLSFLGFFKGFLVFFVGILAFFVGFLVFFVGILACFCGVSSVFCMFFCFSFTLFFDFFWERPPVRGTETPLLWEQLSTKTTLKEMGFRRIL